MLFSIEKNWLPLTLSLMLGLMLSVSGESADSATSQNNSPIAVFTQPRSGASLPIGSDMFVVVDAKDGDGSIANVKLWINGQFIRQENTSPYQWANDNRNNDPVLRELKAGTYNLTAVATDNNGAATTINTSVVVQASQNNSKPIVKFVQPSIGASLPSGSDMFVVVDAKDSDGSIANVQLWVNDQFIRQESAAPYQWANPNENKDPVLRNLKAGTYNLTAVATDNKGNTTTINNSIRVGSTVPTIIPTTAPSATPAKTPVATPAKTPLATPTKTPLAAPTKTPTATPTKTPTATPTKTPATTLPASYSANCMGCHGENGIGGLGGSLQNYPQTHSLTQMINVIRQGKSFMPAFPASKVSDTDIGLMYSFFSGSATPTATPIKPPTPTPTKAPINNETFELTEAMFPDKTYIPLKNRLYRLTKPQIVGTLNVVLGTNLPPNALGNDPNVGGFRTDANALSLNDQKIITQIEQLIDSNFKINSDSSLRTFMQCSSDANLACLQNNCNCFNGYLTKLTQTAFRRTLTEQERTNYLALIAKIDTYLDYSKTAKYLLYAVLTDPAFLFRQEIGQISQTGAMKLSDETILANANLVTTNQPPLITELARASSIVQSPAAFGAHVDTLLKSVKGTELLSTFFKQWLEIESMDEVQKDPAIFPKFTQVVATAMNDEKNAFIKHVASQEKVTLSYLLTSRYSVLSPALASFYGETTSGETMVNPLRKGILAKGAFLAINGGLKGTVPTKRGEKILIKLLCEDTPGLPANIPLSSGSNQASTTRERFELHASNPDCKSCHEILDPLGFGLENFAADGSYRTQESGFPINAAASLTTLPFTTNLSFNGPVELIDQLAQAPEMNACLVRQVFRFTQGYTERNEDNPVLAKALDDYYASGWDVRAVFKSILTNKSVELRQ